MKSKAIKKIGSLVLAVCITLSVFGTAVSAAALESEDVERENTLMTQSEPSSVSDFSYSITDGVVAITGYTGAGGIVVIPSEIEGCPVRSIGDFAFECCSSLTSITIPNSVTRIDSSAFDNCSSLTAINVDANNQTYSSKDGVLFNKDKTEIVCCPAGKSGEYIIPDSVTSIGDYAFEFCSGLTSITIPNSVTSIGDFAFECCSNLTSITIPYSVTSIGDSAFRYCSSLTSITIPNSVTSIDRYAFYYCSSLTSITIPNSVTSINRYAFYYCSSLTAINVDANNQTYSSKDGVLFNKDKTVIVCCPAGKSGEYVIPDSVTSIGDYAFRDCSSLTSITIPDSVTSIGDYAFSYCRSLSSITIPDSVTSIGDWAFSNCYSLTSITIPNSVTSIGDSAFYGCRSLTSITIPDSVTSIGHSAFESCSSLSDVYYGGTEAQWDLIDIESGNTSLTNATIHYADEHICEFGEWIVRTEPTCTVTGEKYRVCSVCGEEENEVIPATGHHYIAVVIDPTCTEGGYTTHTCENCGDSYIDSETSAHGHSFGDWIVRTAATCTEDGEKFRVCSVCGAEETEVIPATCHNYATVVTEPTCKQSGYTTYTCTVCGHSYISDYVSIIEHSFSTVTVEPTCTEQGYTTHTCENCGYYYVDSYTDSLGHNFGDWTVRTEATCTEDGVKVRVCTVCGEEETEVIPATRHHYTAVDTDPTCTQAGYTTYTCTVCGESYISDYVSMKGHSYNAVVTLPTCKQSGYTTYTCTACGHSYISDYVSILSHSFSAVTVAPTCTEHGYTLHTCESCCASYKDSFTNALGHDYSGDWITESELSYNTDGRKSLYCTHCHELLEAEVVPALIIGDLEYTVSDDEIVITKYNGSSAELVIPAVIDGYPVAVIGENAFSYCHGIESIILPDSVMEIKDWAFLDCINIVNMNMGKSVTVIGKGAFAGCAKLTNIVIPDNVTTIDYSAFRECYAVNSVIIGKGVRKIGKYAFADCYNITDVYYSGTEEDWSGISIEDGNNILVTTVRYETKVSSLDLDSDGILSTADMVLLKKELLGTGTSSAYSVAFYAADETESFNIIDLVRLKKYLAGAYSLPSSQDTKSNSDVETDVVLTAALPPESDGKFDEYIA